ncbi:MAG: hypothetical protein ACRCXT_14090 [Paraclostridium sp.]
MKYTEDVKIDESIKITKKDKERYIGKTFRANCGLDAKCIGIYDVYDYNSTKRYVVEFEDGRKGVAEGGKLRSGSFVPLPFTPQKKETKITEDERLLNENKSLRKKNQSLMDKLRILRKEDRQSFRDEYIENEFIESLKQAISDFDFDRPIPSVPSKKLNTYKYAIAQLSDIHANQLVDLKHNEYDMDIFEKRMMIYANKVIDKLNTYKINNLTLSFGGDIFHLDERLDMLLSSQYNRAVSFVKIYDVFCLFIDRFIQEGLNISMVGIVGNESRMKAHQHFSNIDEIASDSLDYMLYAMLQRRYENHIEFMNDGNVLETVFQVGDKHIASTHGNNLNHGKLHEEVSKLKFRMYEDFNVIPDYVLVHHIHSPIITHSYSRNASLVGSNGYSSKALNITNSSVSQNLIIVDNDITAMIIDCKEDK